MKRIVILMLISLLFSGCIARNQGVTRKEFLELKGSTSTWVQDVSQEINETNVNVQKNKEDIVTLSKAISRIVDVQNETNRILFDHEVRIEALEGQEPPEPPEPGEWYPGIKVDIDNWTHGVVIFEIRGLRNAGNPENPSLAGKDILLALTRYPLDLNYQRLCIEIRKYYIFTNDGLINLVKLKISKDNSAVEPYMSPTPPWDPDKIYKITVKFETGYTKVTIEVDGVEYMVDAHYSWAHQFNVLVLGATPKYSAPPGAEFRLISLEGGK